MPKPLPHDHFCVYPRPYSKTVRWYVDTYGKWPKTFGPFWDLAQAEKLRNRLEVWYTQGWPPKEGNY